MTTTTQVHTFEFTTVPPNEVKTTVRLTGNSLDEVYVAGDEATPKTVVIDGVTYTRWSMPSVHQVDDTTWEFTYYWETGV